jgi:hypothetical protein
MTNSARHRNCHKRRDPHLTYGEQSHLTDCAINEPNFPCCRFPWRDSLEDQSMLSDWAGRSQSSGFPTASFAWGFSRFTPASRCFLSRSSHNAPMNSKRYAGESLGEAPAPPIHDPASPHLTFAIPRRISTARRQCAHSTSAMDPASVRLLSSSRRRPRASPGGSARARTRGGSCG